MKLGVREYYRCDGCQRIDEGWSLLPPEGWVGLRWIPGIIEPPGQGKVPVKHACSDGCKAKIMSEINAKRGAR